MRSPMEFRHRRRCRPPSRCILRPTATLAVAALAGCSSGTSPSGVDTPTPSSMVAVEGVGLKAPAGTVLPEGPTVEVRDQHGDPMAGVTVSFEVQAGGGVVPVPSRDTDGMGRARVPWILGSQPGTAQRLRASAGNLSAEFQASGISPVPGQSYLGRNGYIEYLPGTLPLVLSAPHGGDMTPAEIPDRTQGTTVRDTNTRELALEIRDALFRRTGAFPHVVISHLHRIKLDPNREIVEAAEGDPEAERAWWEFQTFVDKAGESVEAASEAGLYIDLHGHGHEIQRLELGYLLTAADLASTNEGLANLAFAQKSSFRALGLAPGVDFAELIRGPSSLGSLLEAVGFPSVPSQNQPDPGDDPYFSGGYNVAVHGSRGGGSVSGVQIECNFTGVRDTGESRRAFAESLANVLEAFFPIHFGMDLAH